MSSWTKTVNRPQTSIRAAPNQFFDDMTEASDRQIVQLESEMLQELSELDLDGCINAHRCGEVGIEHILTWMKLDYVESLYFMGAELENVAEFLDFLRADKILRINMIEHETFAGAETVWEKNRLVWRVHGRHTVRMSDGECKFRVNTDVSWYPMQGTRPTVISAFTRICTKEDTMIDKAFHKRLVYPDEKK